MKKDGKTFPRLIYKDLIKLFTIRVSKLSLLFLVYTHEKVKKILLEIRLLNWTYALFTVQRVLLNISSVMAYCCKNLGFFCE